MSVVTAKTMRMLATIVCIAACLAVVVTCTTDYVTGKRTFSLVSESQGIGRRAAARRA